MYPHFPLACKIGLYCKPIALEAKFPIVQGRAIHRGIMAALDFIFTGDLVLDEPRPDYWLSGIAPVTSAANITIGHLEVPHTNRCAEMRGDVPAPGADPANLAALKRAGFDAVTLAGNHIADCGTLGITDTCDELARIGLEYTGAGVNLAAARRPAILHNAERRIALLSYNCVGPQAGWATETAGGCAYVRIMAADGGEITPTASLQSPDCESLMQMQADVAAAASGGSFVVVALHKGLVHTPARLAPYERPVAWAAIDAGAQVVISHHAHLIRGMEFYCGKPIFHGLGNGCVVTRALSPGQDNPARAAWVERRKKLFGFEPDPEYSLAPFHPDAVNAILGRLKWHDDGRIEAGFVPVHVEAPGRPIIADEAQAAATIAYVARITREAGLPPLSLRSRDDMVVAA
jgi:poly-gamma-glutamate capsule biosynthesis protein CapA/YwtB (metallophosphatase superfamily)